MFSHFAARLKSPIGRTSLFYATLYLPMGVALPYFPIWLSDKGLSTEQIGTINALPILVLILFSVFVGRSADKASDWRPVIIAGALAAAVTPVLLFFSNDFWSVLIVWALVSVPAALIMPVIDAAAVRLARRVGGQFGHIRIWGTLGFVLMIMLTGLLVDWYGAAVFLALFLAVSILRAVLSLQLPNFRAAQPAQPLADAKDEGEAKDQGEVKGAPTLLHPMVATKISHTWRPWFLLPLLGIAFLHGSHMLQANFGALMWRDAGVPPAIIGPLWALSPGGEMVVMLFFHRFAKRFSARHLLAAACLFSVLRWIGMAMEPPIWGLALLQLMNMLTFGLSYLGLISFIANWTSDEIAAEAQSFSVMLRQIAAVLTLPLYGYLVAQWGTGAYYASAFFSAIGVVLVLISLRLLTPKTEGMQAEATSS